jgi:hypothetical protein
MQINSFNDQKLATEQLYQNNKLDQKSPTQKIAEEMFKETTSGSQAMPKQMMQLLNNLQPLQNANELAKQQISKGKLDIKI